MNARERLRLMIRDNPGSMTIWSQPEIDAAFAAYDAELLATAEAWPGELGHLRALITALTKAVLDADNPQAARRLLEIYRHNHGHHHVDITKGGAA